MMRQFYPLILFLLAIGYSFGQSKELQLSYECKGQTAGFSSVKVIDNRSQTQLIGIVQKGLSSKSAEVIYKGSLTDSLAAYFTDTTSRPIKASLVLMINELFLNQLEVGADDVGRLRLALRLFIGSTSDRFTELMSIDSIYTISGRNVTKKLLQSVSEQFCTIASQAAQWQVKQVLSDSTRFSFQELLSLDSLEKLKLPMYRTNHPKAGIYKNYTRFKLNNPDTTSKIFIDERKNATLIYVWDEKRQKKTKLVPTGLFAVSDGSSVWRATALGFYKMFKEGSDFYYWRPRPDYSSSAAVPVMGLMFGAVGGLAAGVLQEAVGTKKQWLLQKVNHRKGHSVPVSWVHNKPNEQ